MGRISRDRSRVLRSIWSQVKPKLSRSKRSSAGGVPSPSTRSPRPLAQRGLQSILPFQVTMASSADFGVVVIDGNEASLARVGADEAPSRV